MNLELTQKQYETLLKLAYLGDYMINGIRTEEDRVPEYADLMQKLYLCAEEANCGALVERDKKMGRFFPAGELEEDRDVKQYREEYDNEIFWEELIDKLSLRDFMALQGSDTLNGALAKDITQAKSGIIKKYIEEFEKNGVENLKIVG